MYGATQIQPVVFSRRGEMSGGGERGGREEESVEKWRNGEQRRGRKLKEKTARSRRHGFFIAVACKRTSQSPSPFAEDLRGQSPYGSTTSFRENTSKPNAQFEALLKECPFFHRGKLTGFHSIV